MMDPNNLKYTKDHEWINIDGDYAIVGITNFAQKELGDIVFVEIESLNQEINSGEVFGSVEAVKTVSDLFMPITGKIVEINEKVVDNPELVNSDPYGEGWIIKIKILDLNEVESLLDLKSYEEISG
ncbi:MAG: glycine cleavage system protein H [Flammeovirgaceae bacterium]|nr:glycine cleavage system protein H [Flammeovirgaceae bacterium]